MKKTISRATFFGVAAGLLLGVTLSIGFGLGMAFQSTQLVSNNDQDPDYANRMYDEVVLKADSAANGKKIALATGELSRGIEGVFALDFLTGDLYCWVPADDGSGFIAVYKANVQTSLGLQKGKPADYVMTTGRMNFRTVGTGAVKASDSVVYIADGNSGKVVGYTCPIQKNVRGGQSGAMIPVLGVTTREASIERE